MVERPVKRAVGDVVPIIVEGEAVREPEKILLVRVAVDLDDTVERVVPRVELVDERTAETDVPTVEDEIKGVVGRMLDVIVGGEVVGMMEVLDIDVNVETGRVVDIVAPVVVIVDENNGDMKLEREDGSVELLTNIEELENIAASPEEMLGEIVVEEVDGMMMLEAVRSAPKLADAASRVELEGLYMVGVALKGVAEAVGRDCTGLVAGLEDEKLLITNVELIVMKLDNV